MQRSPVKTRFRFTFWVMIALVAFAVLQVFTFCSRTISCPAFSDAAFDAWLPYQQDQWLFFINSRQQKDSIRIGVVERSQAEVVKGGGYNSPKCNIYAYIRGNGNVFLNIQNQEAKAVSLALDDFNFYGGAMGDSGIRYVPETGPYKTVYYYSHTLGAQTFNNVELLEKDTTGMKGGEHIYRVYLSRENGIIAYERYPSHDLWLKQ